VAIGSMPVRIAQLSDIHCGTPTFEPALLAAAIERINAMQPDATIVVGDLTAAGHEQQFDEAAEWLARIDSPTVVVQGNHDARNLGHLHFERHFGDRFTHRRLAFDDERAARVGAAGLTIVAVDSSVPDLNEGHIGREWYPWIQDRFAAVDDDLKVFVLHHHLVAIPGTGRERNIVTDAGDVLEVLTQCDVDLVLSGHKHVPFFWGVNGTLVVNSGTACTRRVRGLTPPSWNEIVVDAAAIKVFTHYEDGRRELSVIRARAERAQIRQSLQLTEAFRRTNRLVGERR
jgi:Icc protein